MRKQWQEILTKCETEKDIISLRNYIISLPETLRCRKCRNHMTTFLKNNNVNTIESVSDYILFIVKFYNDINTTLNKPTYSYEQLCMKYGVKKIDFDFQSSK